MLCGVITYAAVLEEAVAHPGTPLHLEWRAAPAAALLLFVGGAAGALRPAGRRPELAARSGAVPRGIPLHGPRHLTHRHLALLPTL
jgi:hypothetical protein